MTANSKLNALNELHAERSRCIDAFAEVEELIVSLFDLLGCKSVSASFGQRVEVLAKAQATPRFSKQRLARLRELLTECADVSLIRNDIVHARLQLAELDSQYRACFVNAWQCLSGGQTARLFSMDGLRELHDRLRRLSTELKQVLINPASSPPPPLRAAAGGP